jgi:hypothetical protein
MGGFRAAHDPDQVFGGTNQTTDGLDDIDAVDIVMVIVSFVRIGRGTSSWPSTRRGLSCSHNSVDRH